MKRFLTLALILSAMLGGAAFGSNNSGKGGSCENAAAGGNAIPGSASDTETIRPLARAKGMDSVENRRKIYAEVIANLNSARVAEEAGNLMHQQWQKTNTYRTRFKVMKDTQGKPITDLQAYFKKREIRKAQQAFYRLNKDGIAEEDIKYLSNVELAPNNRQENADGGEAVVRQTIHLITASPANHQEARRIVAEALQELHRQWLGRNSWAQNSYPKDVTELSGDLQITNAMPLLEMLKLYMDDEHDAYHIHILQALRENIKVAEAKRVEQYEDTPVEEAYLEMVLNKGLKIALDPALSEFFETKIPHKSIYEREFKSKEERLEYLAKQFAPEVRAKLSFQDDYKLVAPKTAPGSGAEVFLVIDRKRQVVGALKIQGSRYGGLDELLSTLAVRHHIMKQRMGVEVADVAAYGVLNNDSYFLLIKPAQIMDLDHWIEGSQQQNGMFQANMIDPTVLIQATAKATAEFHGFDQKHETASKDSLQLLKSNALYDLRKFRQLLDENVIRLQAIKGGVTTTRAEYIAEKAANIADRYEAALEAELEKFQPTTVHGDFHGGNVFLDFRGVSNQADVTIIDFAGASWTLGKKGQLGAGDPANDLGRMMAHFVVEGIKRGQRWNIPVLLTREFYDSYLAASFIKRNSPEEHILRHSVYFYMSRYFLIQLTDTKGTKFNSKTLTREELIQALFESWNRLEEYF